MSYDMKSTLMTLIVGSLVAACGVLPQTRTRSNTQGSALAALDPYACHARSLWVEGSSFVGSGTTRNQAADAARQDCESQTGDRACVVTRCGAGVDNGRSDLEGASICEWEDALTGMSGMTAGPSRISARRSALQDCQTGSGHPAGIECRILRCFAEGNIEP